MDIDFKKIYQLRQKINELLDSRPKLRHYQDFIDQELEKAGDNHHNRCVVLENLLRENQLKLVEQLNLLSQTCRNLKSKRQKSDKNE